MDEPYVDEVESHLKELYALLENDPDNKDLKELIKDIKTLLPLAKVRWQFDNPFFLVAVLKFIYSLPFNFPKFYSFSAFLMHALQPNGFFFVISSRNAQQVKRRRNVSQWIYLQRVTMRTRKRSRQSLKSCVLRFASLPSLSLSLLRGCSASFPLLRNHHNSIPLFMSDMPEKQKEESPEPEMPTFGRRTAEELKVFKNSCLLNASLFYLEKRSFFFLPLQAAERHPLVRRRTLP
jgi:hypothetical protein